MHSNHIVIHKSKRTVIMDKENQKPNIKIQGTQKMHTKKLSRVSRTTAKFRP